MSTERISPVAARVIDKCGGHKAVALLTGLKVPAIYRWTYPKSKGGRGGHIPPAPREKIIEAAKAGLVVLTADDFVDLPPANEKRRRA